MLTGSSWRHPLKSLSHCSSFENPKQDPDSCTFLSLQISGTERRINQLSLVLWSLLIYAPLHQSQAHWKISSTDSFAPEETICTAFKSCIYAGQWWRNSLCRLGCSPTHSDPPGPAFQVLGLKSYPSMTWSASHFLFLCVVLFSIQGHLNEEMEHGSHTLSKGFIIKLVTL